MARFKEDYNKIQQGFGHCEAIRQILLPRLLPRIGIGSGHSMYEKSVYSFLQRHFRELFEKYKSEIPSQERREIEPIIWTIWWQGENAMPEVIRLCYQSIVRNANGRSVILLTKDNYKEYIEVPEYIERKFRDGIITITHLTDLIRVSLLEKYGGLYLDCALFVTKPIVLDKIPFFSTRVEGGIKDCIPNRNKWVFGMIGSYKGDVVARFMKVLFFAYWATYDVQIHYLMMDYILQLAYTQIPAIKEEIDLITKNSPDLHSSRYLFSKKADFLLFNDLINNNICLSLTWRYNYPQTTEDNELTYFGKLVEYSNRNSL